jgi:cell division septal protein FtsQ
MHQSIRDKYQLQLKRKATMIAAAKQTNLQDNLKNDYLVIFPAKPLTAWDKLPRFTFLDADLAKLQNKEMEKSRINQPVKSIFVGSPVRVAE